MMTVNQRTAYTVGSQAFSLSSSSEAVVAACRAILYAKALPPDTETDLNVSASAIRDGWHLEVNGNMVAGLAKRTPIPLVAEKLISTACSALAKKNEAILVDGVFLQRDSVCVALLGDDIDSAQILGLHLQSRGWSLASFRSAFISKDSLDFVGLPASLSLSSSSLDGVPSRFRPAVERSLWYDNGYDLCFYTVETPDLRILNGPTRPLTHVVIVDGEMDDAPLLTGSNELAGLGPLAYHKSVRSLRAARLTIGTPIASCCLIERWLLGESA